MWEIFKDLFVVISTPSNIFPEARPSFAFTAGHYCCCGNGFPSNWACLQLRKITFALHNWHIYNLTSCLKAQKKRVCQNLTHPLS